MRLCMHKSKIQILEAYRTRPDADIYEEVLNWYEINGFRAYAIFNKHTGNTQYFLWLSNDTSGEMSKEMFDKLFAWQKEREKK
uniref:Uncharacterized protein n=1 Tax=Panagrolaimus sp. PS1159 TaxID=55785 RepID=A0AC35FLX4_9BILA